MKEATGKVVQVIGPVVEVEFPAEQLPELNNAVQIKFMSDDREIDVILEVAQHLGNNVVRCIAMSSTDGLQRGMGALDLEAPISVPVGEQVLGRILNVLGETI